MYYFAFVMKEEEIKQANHLFHLDRSKFSR
jgi:hypothetical protein